MTTIVNTPATQENTGSSTALLGLVLLLVFAFLLFFYGLPALRGATQQVPTNVNVEAPQGVDVPDQIDVNINQQPEQ